MVFKKKTVFYLKKQRVFFCFASLVRAHIFSITSCSGVHFLYYIMFGRTFSLLNERNPITALSVIQLAMNSGSRGELNLFRAHSSIANISTNMLRTCTPFLSLQRFHSIETSCRWLLTTRN